MPEMRAAAKGRQLSALRQHHRSGKLPERENGRSRDKAATFTGYAARTLDKAEAIVAAAEEAPERFGRLVDDMDRTGRVDGPFKRLKVMRQSACVSFAKVNANLGKYLPKSLLALISRSRRVRRR